MENWSVRYDYIKDLEYGCDLQYSSYECVICKV